MKIIRNLFYEQYKNFRIILRNLSSVLLLILGPLALILLIGFAYSGDSIHNIKIGVVSADYDSLEPAFANFSSFSQIYRYNDTASCVKDINIQEMHICLEFSEHFVKSNGTDIPSGTITFYFDNSRKALSNKIVDSLSDYFGVEAEKISIESAKTIFANIQSLVIYLEQKNQDIDQLIIESEGIKQDLNDRHERLVEIHEEFIPIYNKSKDIQSRMNNLSKDVNSSYSSYHKDIDDLSQQLKSLKKELRRINREIYIYEKDQEFEITSDPSLFLNVSNITYYNLSLYNFTLNENNLTLFLNETLNKSISVDLSKINEVEFIYISSAMLAIQKVEDSLESLSYSSEQYYNYTTEQKMQFDQAVELLDQVNEMLELDIRSTEEYVIKIDAASKRVSQIQKELNSSLNQLSKLEPGLAEKLVKPILQNYEAVLPGIENIKLAFPGMLAIIIIFISILFSNIVTLTELNSKAFYRNMIAPVDSLIFIVGLILTNIIIVSFQIFVLLLVGQFQFRIELFSNLPLLFLVVFLLTLFFICLGMIIAVLIRNSQTSILTTTFLALGFFLFSDAVAPLETMPELAAFFASKNPFVIASLAFKKIIIFQLPWESIAAELIGLSIYLAVSLIILITVSKIMLKETK